MKYFKILTILLFSSIVSFYSCNETAKTPKQETVKSNEVTTPNTTTTKTTAKSDGKVWHYICSKGCEGGSAATGNCSNCGSTLSHNAAFHAKDNNTQNASPLVNPSNTNSNTGQNAAGVWHYTCGKGCAGGSGTAGACGTCGNTLNHNQAYHQ